MAETIYKGVDKAVYNRLNPLDIMKKYLLIIILLASSAGIRASVGAGFEKNFCDSTLRIDYTFLGNATTQSIAVDKLNMMPRWYGKRNRLGELPVEGNGQITVRKHGSSTIIYRNSFSTLFQEWQSYDEAKDNVKSFENVFLVPMPRDTVDITVDLRNNRHEIIGTLTHTVCPEDILIRRIGFGKTTPFVTLQSADDTTKCIHIAYVAEGYKAEEMSVFLEDAKIATEALFKHEPFKTMRNRFNIVAVESSSVDSGTSEPSKGVWRNTVLGSHFDTFYSNRYLTTLNLKSLHDVLAGIPYEHIIVLVNTEEYGGGGILNSYNLSMTHHPLYRQVVVHEFGHSFAGLADEYAYETEQIPMYPHDIEPWEKNITTLVDFHNKWEGLIAPGTHVPTPMPKTQNSKAKGKHNIKDSTSEKIKVGVYEGAGYSLKGVYRPYPDCRMRSNEHKDFCPACQKALSDLIKFYTE